VVGGDEDAFGHYCFWRTQPASYETLGWLHLNRILLSFVKFVSNENAIYQNSKWNKVVKIKQVRFKVSKFRPSTEAIKSQPRGTKHLKYQQQPRGNKYLLI
jgi:hypothetical protein